RHDFHHLFEGPAGHEPGRGELMGQGVDADLFGPPPNVAVELVEHCDPEGSEVLAPLVGALNGLVHEGLTRGALLVIPSHDVHGGSDCRAVGFLPPLPFGHFWPPSKVAVEAPGVTCVAAPQSRPAVTPRRGARTGVGAYPGGATSPGAGSWTSPGSPPLLGAIHSSAPARPRP